MLKTIFLYIVNHSYSVMHFCKSIHSIKKNVNSFASRIRNESLATCHHFVWVSSAAEKNSTEFVGL